MDLLIHEKQRRRQAKDTESTSVKGTELTEPEKTLKDPGLSMLVKSVKNKTKRFHNRKNQSSMSM